MKRIVLLSTVTAVALSTSAGAYAKGMCVPICINGVTHCECYQQVGPDGKSYERCHCVQDDHVPPDNPWLVTPKAGGFLTPKDLSTKNANRPKVNFDPKVR